MIVIPEGIPQQIKDYINEWLEDGRADRFLFEPAEPELLSDMQESLTQSWPDPAFKLINITCDDNECTYLNIVKQENTNGN